MLEALAVGGMNVARLNLAHGGHEYHQAVVARIRQLNKDKGYSVAIMVGAQGRGAGGAVEGRTGQGSWHASGG